MRRSRAPRPACGRREARGRGRAGHSAAAARSASDICGDRVDRESLQARKVELNIVSAGARARRGTRALPRQACPRRAGRPTEECAARLESFLPSSPSRSPWWTTSGSSPPSARAIRCCTSSFGRWSEPRMMCVISRSRSSTTVASWYVGVPSARARVVPASRIDPSVSRIAPFPSASSAASAWRSTRLALADRTLVPCDAEPAEVGQDRLLTSWDASLRIGVVDTQHERAAVLVGKRAVGDRAERVAEMERPRRARGEADAHGEAHASIVT